MLNIEQCHPPPPAWPGGGIKAREEMFGRLSSLAVRTAVRRASPFALGTASRTSSPGLWCASRSLSSGAAAPSSEAATYVLHDDPLASSEEAVDSGVSGDGKFAVVRLGGTQRDGGVRLRAGDERRAASLTGTRSRRTT